MQHLKENVKQKIIGSALFQFSEKGYDGASMREIAAEAGVVSGNIYRYFKNKEDLYDRTVGPVYSLLCKIEKKFQADVSENATQLASRGCYKVARDITSQVLKIFSGHRREMLILLDKSDGTKYADSRENLKRAVNCTLKELCIAELKKQGKQIDDDYIIYVLSSSFIDGICLILRSSSDTVRLQKLINSWLNIIFDGLQHRL